MTSPLGLVRLIRERLALNAEGVAPRMARAVYAGASLSRCDATCCKGGVAVSIRERDAILGRRDAVVRAMSASPRAGVRPEGGAWFRTAERRDADFLGGRSVDTRVVAGACVFLRGDRLCAIQVASAEAAGHPYALKPAYCILFPACVEKGKIDLCRGSYTRRPECCAPVRAGRRTPLAVLRGTLALIRRTPRRGPLQGARESLR